MNNILFVAEHFRSYEVQWHQHECWELVYCTAGDGYFKFENGASIQYKVGDVVAIPPHERHTNISNQDQPLYSRQVTEKEHTIFFPDFLTTE